MKRHYAVALVIIMMSAAVGHAQQKQIQFGWNYFELDTTYMNMGNAVALFGNSMRSTLYHTGADTVTSKRFSNAVAGTGGQIIAISGGAVGAYSNSQRMRIEALPIDDFQFPSDSLTKYYFFIHDSIDKAYSVANETSHVGSPYSPPFDHWEIEPSGSHGDSVVISGNQFANSWTGQATHYDTAASKWVANPWRLALGLQIPDTNITGVGHSDTIVELWAIHANPSSVPLDTLKFYIRWDTIPKENTDYTFFSAWDTFPHIIGKGDYINFQVRSRRYTTVRLSFACVLDSLSYNLSSFDLDPSNTALQALRDSVKSLLYADTAFIYRQWNGEIAYYFIANEPVYAQGWGMKYVNQFINRRGNTELQGIFDEARFLAQVKPSVLWQAGNTAQGNQICEFKDSIADTSTNWPYYGGFEYFGLHGYPSDPMPNPIYTYAAAEDTSTDYLPYLNHPLFDPLDLYPGGWLTLQIGGYASTSGIMANVGSNESLLQADSANGWWCNIFNSAIRDTAGYQYLYSSFPPVPEQFQFLSNLALLQGAKGILFSQAISTGATDSTNYVGFVDPDCVDTGDWKAYPDNTLPTMFKRNCRWGARYAQFLHSSGYILADKQWRWSFGRNSYEQTDYTVASINSESGNAAIDTSADLMLRPALNASLDTMTSDASWKARPQIYPSDTSEYHWDTLPRWLNCYIASYFSADTNTISAQNPGYIGICPLTIDNRDLYCRWQNDFGVDTFVRRGSRLITIKLALPSTYGSYEISEVGGTLDTVLGYNSPLALLYAPSQLRILRVSPYCSDTIYAGDTLTIPASADSVISCYIHVDSGGVFHIKRDAHVELAGFTIAKGGTFIIDTAAHLNLIGNHPDTCNGKMIMNGGASGLGYDSNVVITGLPTSPNILSFVDTSIESNATILAQGVSGDTEPWHIIANGVDINGVDMQGLIAFRGNLDNALGSRIIGTTTIIGGTTSHPTAVLDIPDTEIIYTDTTITPAALNVLGTLNLPLHNGSSSYSGGNSFSGTGGDVMDVATSVYPNATLNIAPDTSGLQTSVRLNCNLAVEDNLDTLRYQHGTMNVAAGTALYVGYPHQYYCVGAMNLNGAAGDSVTITDYNTVVTQYPTFFIGNLETLYPATYIANDSALGIVNMNCTSSNNVFFTVGNAAQFIAAHCDFAYNVYTLADMPYSCVELDNDTNAVVDSCVFTSGSVYTTPPAIAINGNLGAFLDTLTNCSVTYTRITGFAKAIITDGSKYLIRRDSLINCGEGIEVDGTQLPAQYQTIDSNVIRASGLSSYASYGVLLAMAEPYIYHNTIAWTQYGVLSSGGSSATLACNTIDSNVWGVSVPDGNASASDSIHMDTVRWQNKQCGNSVFDNDSADILMGDYGGTFPGISLKGGDNNIYFHSTTPTGFLITDQGAHPTGYAGYNAQYNWFHPVPVHTHCGGGWSDTATWAFNPSPGSSPPYSCSAAADNGAAEISSGGGGSGSCIVGSPEYYTDLSYYTGDPCDSLLFIYVAQMHCGYCDTALFAVEAALNSHCPSETQPYVEQLLKNVLTSTLTCYGRQCEALSGVALWFYNYAQTADSDYQRHAAMWMYAQTLEALQNYDTAASVYQYIHNEDWAPPEDSALASVFHNRAIHLSLTGGSTDSCWGQLSGGGSFGKKNTQSKASLPPIMDIFNMQAYPNPFNPALSVTYQISPDDGGGGVNISLYDLMGREIATMFNGVQSSGSYTAQLNAQGLGLSAGVYLIKIQTMNHVQTKQVMLIK